MTEPHQEYKLSPTTTDLELALAFYSVLVEQARKRERITYGRLAERSKAKFPNNDVVQNANAISVGRRLDFVREFTRKRNLPDLSSLVVNKETGECGVGFTRNYDAEQAREEVFNFDWSAVSTEFTGAVAEATRRTKPTKKIKEGQALQLMSEYYFANKNDLPRSIAALRSEIIALLMEGYSAEVAFSRAQKDSV